jgi:putative FmdB family regulatory protein
MPIYEYVCDDCGAEYERLVMKQGTAVSCPKCASAKNTIKLSVFAAHGNGGGKANGGYSSSSSNSGPMSGGGCCGGGCGCN